jgi:hypothetical protein
MEEIMSINFSQIFSKAWTITWKYKVLWFFGFLAMLGGGGGWNGFNGGGGIGPNLSYNYRSDEIDRRYIPPEWRSSIDQLERVDINTWISVIVLSVCCLLLLALALWLVSIIGRGGLISGIVAADTAGKAGLRETWNAGVRFFLRLFVIRLLGVAFGLAVALFVFLPGAFIGMITCGIGFIPVACFLFIVGIVVNLWFAFMDYAVVVENQGIGEAVGRAWTILRNHIGPVLVFWILLLAASIVVGIGLLILFAPSAVFLFLSLLPLITGTGPINTTLLAIGIVLAVLFVLAAMIVKAVYTVWETAVMTLAYREFGKATPLFAVKTTTDPQPAASG